MANKAKALIILTPGFPENEADSTCLPPQQVFVKALKDVDPAIHIIVLSFQYPFFAKEYYWHGIRVISFGNTRNSRIIRRFTGVKVWFELLKLHQEYHLIGLLSFWLGKCAYIGSLFARKNNLQHYTWLLGQDAKAGNKYFNKAKPTGKSLIALSDFLVKEFYKNYGIQPAHIIPVGIDTTLFGSGDAERNIDIIGAGNLIPLKQYDVFLDVIAGLKISLPTIKAVLCGDGPEREKLKEKATSMGLKNNVSFAGRLPHSEVLALMQQSKAFLHTSNYEGFGAVCLEALYAGNQVVSFVKPMDDQIANWHTASDKDHMIALLEPILSAKTTTYKPVLPYPIQANANAMLQIFDQSEAATSRILPAMASKESFALK
jgi:glycosyltransferase involved in cell wall biosynthesis